ncbi:MAG: cob(I)yrinic acid a,c-diamide adenosyltransferase [Patescibacteria group bacterium]|jgi:cob(I)alamin adenosyltransferase
MPTKKHYIHLYYGDGKGKTTAALGLALRAVGHGQKVIMLQWLKGRKDIGEVKAQQFFKNKFKIYQFGPTYFTWEKEKPLEHKKLAIAGLKKLEQIITKEKYDILILDEIVDAVVMKFIPKDKTIKLIQKAVKKGEVIITGHKPDKDWLKLSDLATEMKKVKHYFDKGQTARQGVEY